MAGSQSFNRRRSPEKDVGYKLLNMYSRQADKAQLSNSRFCYFDFVATITDRVKTSIKQYITKGFGNVTS